MFQLSRDGTIKGLPQLPRIKYIFDVCHSSKQATKKFPKSVTYTTKTLELVHSNVCGPFKLARLLGAKYFVTFVDDYGQKIWVSLIKSKAQVFSEFRKFKA